MPRRTSEELLHLFQENWPQGYSPAEEVMLRLYHAALRHTEELQRFLGRFDLTTIEFDFGGVPTEETPETVRVLPAAALEAAREFMATGERPTCLEWLAV